MKITVKGSKTSSTLNLHPPGICPFCRRCIVPVPLGDAFSRVSDEEDVTSITAFWSCSGCSGTFATVYLVNASQFHQPDSEFPIAYSLPSPTKRTEVSDEVTVVSPRFVDLFHQSEYAQSAGLVDLAGMGYRKALECLVKDGLVALERETADDVSTLSLRDAINAFGDNAHLCKVANRARAIGNDYAHYSAKYEGYDLDHLKQCIEYAAYFITAEIKIQNMASLTKLEM